MAFPVHRIIEFDPILHSDYNLCCNLASSNHLGLGRSLGRHTPSQNGAQSGLGSDIPQSWSNTI